MFTDEHSRVTTAAADDAGIPNDLDDIPPGPYLAAILSSIEVDSLSGHDRISVLCAEQRMASHYEARTYRSMRSVTDCYADMYDASDANFEETFENSSTEIRAALHLTPRTAEFPGVIPRTRHSAMKSAGRVFPAPVGSSSAMSGVSGCSSW